MEKLCNRTDQLPKSHLEASSSDGISFDNSQKPPASQDPNLKAEHSNHHQSQSHAKPEAPVPNVAASNAADDSSIISVHSVIQPGYHDTKLNIESFQEKWIKEGAPSKIWFSQIIGELAAKPYYHALLTPCKTKINYDAPSDGPNATLFSVLHNKLSQSLRTMLCLNCGFTTGTQILNFIEFGTEKLRGNKANATKNIAEFFRSDWNPKDEDLYAFNARFNTLYNSVLETNPQFGFDQVKDTWIRSMPAEFSDLKTKYQKNSLDDDWINATNIADLYLQTHAEMTNCDISFDTKVKQTKETEKKQEKKAPTISEVRKAKPETRAHFPPAPFDTAAKIEDEIKKMANDGKTIQDVEAKFKADYPFTGCYCCRIKPYQKHYHKANGPFGCPILKLHFPSYFSLPLVSNTINVGRTRRAKTTKNKSTRKKQVPSSTAPASMCYDTGTTPKSLCCKKEYFRELVLFDTPKFVTLAEQDSLATVLGQGMLDVIINNKYRMWIFAYFTAKSDTLLSAVDHLSYEGCTINGAHGKISVTFPTFKFDVLGSQNFEFNILPGKSSNKPVLWKPSPHARVKESTSSNLVKLKRLNEDATLPQHATDLSTGYDVSSSIMIQVPSQSTIKVPLGFAMSIPPHLQCELRPRSSLSLKGINIALGTIDPDYRGEVQAIVTNTTSVPFDINIGQRIAQLIFSPIIHPKFDEVTLLQHSDRGTGGFGSTGSKSLGKSKKSAAPLRFSPSLSTIFEVQTQRVPNKSYSDALREPVKSRNNDVATMSIAQINNIVNRSTQTHVEDVTIPPKPKEVHADAITLFPLSMYKDGTLNITGTSDDDPAPTDSPSENPATTSPPTPAPTAAPPNTPNEDESTSTSLPEISSEISANDFSIDFTNNALPAPTIFINESNIYDYLDDDDDSSVLSDTSNSESLTLDEDGLIPLSSILDPPTTRPIPRIPPTDRVSSTEPKTKIVTTEYIQKCFGFRNINPILKSLKTQSKDTVIVRDTGSHPILSRGETATLPKSKHNSTAVPRPSEYGLIWHYDIVYGNGRAIGGIQYALFFVDRKSRKKKIFGLKDLKKSTLQRAMKKFIREVGFYPDELIADRDFKLIGQHMDDILEPFTQVSGAPSGRQSQNGLSESNWRYICNIARNYLVEHLLPSEFWFFAIKYAVQVSNYIPIKTDSNKLTTPFYEAYKEHPDLRKLLPLFSAAYVKTYASAEGNTLETQTMKAILVGNDDKSDGRLFYNPETKKLLASSDYRLNISCPSGPLFNLQYTEPTSYSLYSDSVTNDAPSFDLSQKVYLSPTHLSHPLQSATVIDIPFKHGDPYTVQLSSDNSILQAMSFDLLPYDPQLEPSGLSPLLTNPWFKHNAKVTLYLTDTMPTPKHGILIQNGTNWSFQPGHTLKTNKRKKKNIIALPTAIEDIEKLIDTKHLSSGWQNSKTVLQNVSSAETFTFIARRVAFMHSTDPTQLTDDNIRTKLDTSTEPEILGFSKKVSATGLSSLYEPKLHEHSKLPPSDKEIWDQSYFEEYMGLHEDTQTWEYISEEQYKVLRPVVGNALPSMAISKVKTDENGKPNRAKYRIVVLGNLDPHNWSNSECFAPVISPLNLRLLISIAATMKRIPKSGDVSQAFVQSFLPEDEKYVIKPPHGCPLTPDKTYLLLKRTLYGLKRSPRHWYETCKKTLIKLGLKPCPNAPCIFTGTIIPNEPPIYLGLFVDDFVYFSASDKVEEKFKTDFGSEYKVDFQDEITHFLGMKFTNVRHDDGHVDIYMNQPADIEELIKKAGLHMPESLSAPTPYRSGYAVDTVPDIDMTDNERAKLNKLLQEYVGSLNWLATQTRPDLSTITNIIAQYCSKCSPGHIDAAKYVIRYLKDTQNIGIKFSSRNNDTMESFVQFPLDPTKLTSLSDTNWGPQDQSVPKETDEPIELDLFKSRSIAGYVIWLAGPVDWVSKRQTYTARSSAQAEIGAVDECTKTILQIIHILEDLNIYDNYHDGPVTIFNDNSACVQWSHNMTTKGLRYIQMRENAVRESVQNRTIEVQHVGGKKNPSDIFTKEDRDVTHFQECRDALCSTPPVKPSSSVNPTDLPLLELRSKGGAVCQAVRPGPTVTMEP